MKINREYWPASSLTFSIKPIAELLDRWLYGARVVIDPFARDSQRGTITNDIDPGTKAEYHMEASDFLRLLIEKNVQADVILLDPPYSTRQISEVYKNMGRKVSQTDTQLAKTLSQTKNLLSKLIKRDGI